MACGTRDRGSSSNGITEHNLDLTQRHRYMATSKINGIITAVKSLLLSNGYVPNDANAAIVFAGLVNGWAGSSLSNYPSFVKNDIGVIFNIPLYRDQIGVNVNAPRIQIVFWPTGAAAIRRMTEGAAWTNWTNISGT